MFKIKLLILLLINFLFISCIKTDNFQQSTKFRIGYIAGEYDGLLLKNYLTSYLNGKNLLDIKSAYEIRASISHKDQLYITNIDNTSDREKITSTLSVVIQDTNLDCAIFENKESLSQFYIFASNDFFLSNKTAVKEIKKNNTEELVKNLLKKINLMEFKCNE